MYTLLAIIIKYLINEGGNLAGKHTLLAIVMKYLITEGGDLAGVHTARNYYVIPHY